MPYLVLATGLAVTALFTGYAVSAERVRSRLYFESAADKTAHYDYLIIAIISVLGVLFSFLLFVYLRAEEKARSLAEKHSADLAKSESLLKENTQEWLQASEELYRVMAEIVDDGMITMDRTGEILSANQTVKQLFGWSPSEIVGKRITTLIPEIFLHEQPSIKDFFLTTESSASCKNIALTGKHQDGSDVSVELSLGFGRRQGNLLIIGALRDISQRKKIKKAMFQVQRMQAIGTLTSGIAHDFNNVFTAILSHLDLATYNVGNETQRREHLDYVMTSATRGAELVKRLLAFSRQTAPQTQNFNPSEMIKETVALLQRSITRRIQITSEFAPGIWTIKGDESQIKQALINLCINARDAMTEGGTISIVLANHTIDRNDQAPPRRGGEFVRISVNDTGEGMSKQVLDRLFEPYFTTKELGKGAGLGLSIASNIVTEHGGWIEVKSKVSSGSRFDLFFPRVLSVVEEPHTFIARGAKAKSPLDGSESILVVDDDYMIRNLMRAVLAYRGYKISEVSDGEEAIEKALSTTEPVDLVLLDLEMPKVDGWGALAKIHAQKPSLPVILCSGAGSSELLDAEAKIAGAARVLGKPFTNPELLRVVRDVLDSAKATILKDKVPTPSLFRQG